MSTKKEIYYKFIFPNYNSLSGSDSDPIPTSDGKDQIGEVKALCNACPSRVITYDQLTATNPIPMYTDGNNGWSADKKITIKNYIDKYLTIPKYFNLRNYWDSYPCQEGGMSLMVSDTPEVGGDQSQYTKFNYGDKVVYCAVMVSSGDFFYNFCLPNEVIEKSGLRDTIVRNKFHDNWYLKSTGIGIRDVNDEKTHVYCYTSTIGNPYNPPAGAEKRVFVQYYFVHGKVVPLGQVYDDDSGELVNLHWQESDTEYTDTDLRVYRNQGVTREYLHCNTGDLIGLPYGAMGSEPEKYSDIAEDLKKDFIDLEVTRRILHYYDGTRLSYNGSIRDVHPTRDIPRIKSGYGFNTVLSYQPPDEYIDADYSYNGNSVRGTPPLQIPYNLLRYCLNDRPPFTDCETVLVMWVADKDPMSSDIISVADLHNKCNFQQYAIPISCRCCFKDPNDSDTGSKHIHHRFLVNYPHRWSLSPSADNIDLSKSRLAYRYHTRRSEAYDKTDSNEDNKFREVLYLQDLVQYSSDYVIAYQHISYINKGFDIQGYILKNYSSAFKKLYCLKTYMQPEITPTMDPDAKAYSNNQNGQYYYIRVNQFDSNNQTVFDINTTSYSSSNRRICICKPNTTDVFKPSDKIFRINANGYKWDPNANIAPTGDVNILGVIRHWGFDDVTYHEEYGYNDWQINDSSFIMMFDANYKVGGNPIFNKLVNVQFTLTDSDTLYTDLGEWNDIYISSLGVTNNNPIHVDSIFHGGTGTTIYPLGILDNHIKLNGVTYGSNSNNKIVVGFENMLDFNQDDMYHFKYIGNEYKPVETVFNYNSTSPRYVTTQRATNYMCIAYVMSYT